MANTPRDYNGIFNESIDAKLSVTAANAQGMLEAPDANYDEETHADNAAHVLRHWCSDSVSLTPIDATNRLLTDSWRAIQSAIYTLVGHIGGWGQLDSKWSGPGLGPAYSYKHFVIASVSGSTLTLYCRNQGGAVVDPRDTTQWSGVSFDARDPLAEPEAIGASGCYIMPPMMLLRFYNSVLGNVKRDEHSRIEAMVVGFDFTTIPATALGTSTFRVFLSHDVSECMTKLDEAQPLYCEIDAQYEIPEQWKELHDTYPTPMVERTAIYHEADWGEDKIIPLTTPEGGPCRCAFPLRDGQSGWNIWGTFKIETSVDEVTWRDITKQWEKTTRAYPRFSIEGKMRAGVYTRLYLGPIAGDTKDHTSGITAVRVRYMYPVADFGVEGSRSPLELRCHWSQRDYMDAVGTQTAITAKDIDSDDHHWFCAKHRDIPAPNRSFYTHDCAQYSSCPLFKLREINRVNELVQGQMTSNQNLLLQQSQPAENGIMNFQYMRPDDGTSAICWGLNPPGVYTSNYDAAFCARTTPFSGAFVFVDESDYYYETPLYEGETLVGQDQHIKIVRGAFWNFAVDMAAVNANWSANRLGDGNALLGILPRRMPTDLLALTQTSDERDGTNDPAYQILAEHLARKNPVTYRDVRHGSAIAYSARDKAGIEGENRIQRAREIVKYVSGVDLEQAGTQGKSTVDNAVVYPAAQTIRGVENVKVALNLKGDGYTNHGRKRMGQGGVNGKVWAMDDLGGGVFRCHCSPGIWISTYIDGEAGERFTVSVPWYGSGNVVQYPPHYSPDGAVTNGANAKLVGGQSHKAVAGDDWTCGYPALSGRRFKIVRAEPGAGDAFGGESSDTWIQSAILKPFFSLDEFMADGGNPLVEITKYELMFGGSSIGTWFDVTEMLAQIPNNQRPYTSGEDGLTGNPFLFWDYYTALDDTLYQDIVSIYRGGDGHTVIEFDPDGEMPGLDEVIHLKDTPNGGESDGNHTITGVADFGIVVTSRTGLSDLGAGSTGQWIPVKPRYFTQVGSGRAFFDLPVFGMITNNSGILLGGYNKARITFKVNGAAQEPKEVTITTPQMTAGAVGVDLGKIASIEVWHHRRDTGEWKQLSYGGRTDTTFDIFLNEPATIYKLYSNGAGDDRYMFHPLLAGDEVYAIYKTTEEISLGGYGEPGAFLRSFQSPSVNRDELKKCDILEIEDDPDGALAAAAAELDGYDFYVSTGLAADSYTSLEQQDVGGAPFAAVDAANYRSFADGVVLIKEAALA